jgi:hypothetical protein
VRKYIALAALFGFLIAAFWMVLGFILFNVPNGRIADLYYLGGELVCPIFPVNSPHDIYGPLVNAFLYASVMWMALQVKAWIRGSGGASKPPVGSN